MKKSKTIEHLTIPLRVCRTNGSVAYFDANNRQVAVVFRRPMEKKFSYSDVVDLRSNPPFLTMSPCPFCGTRNDRGHDPLSHIDARLGIKVNPTEKELEQEEKEEADAIRQRAELGLQQTAAIINAAEQRARKLLG